MKIGERIRKIRKNKKLTMDQLAQRINSSQSAISMYENGHREPDYETLHNIARALDVPISFLFGEEKMVPESASDKVKWLALGDKLEKHNLTAEEVEAILEPFLKHLGYK
jgi:transcriptional regulator with XRE-family HTH domain